ncbi:MAG: zinc-dependent alcohol dehydrogenase family protein [Planctomycetota bacterium]|nr:zinc-dependent alcohol dehydrogenase family protein [Planctomycetota bacterium]
MRAAVFRSFQGPIAIEQVPLPIPSDADAVIELKACGICRSDWHAWMGHDTDIQLPHVPGHELSGVVANVGKSVRRFHAGQRVTVPFCCGCGACTECNLGNTHICDNHSQPGFTHWGGFADQVLIRCADTNLVALPDSIDFASAASLGCRFITAFRALIDQAKLQRNEWIAIHGCGGVGLSAIMIAKALGAQIIALDIQPNRLESARELGADFLLNPSLLDPSAAIRDITGRGAHVSIDALGHRQTCFNSIDCLAKRGRHVQVGLMLAEDSHPAIPMASVIAKELEIYGSHGMQPTHYPRIFEMIDSGAISPERLVSNTVGLHRGAQLLTQFAEFPNSAMTIIDFSL